MRRVRKEKGGKLSIASVLRDTLTTHWCFALSFRSLLSENLIERDLHHLFDLFCL